MDPRENLLRIYRELADWYERQHQPQMRDRFLVLAADAALTAGRPDEAERLRHRLLKVNPHHMLKPFGSYAQALKTPDVLTYVKDLRVNYPANVAEDLLRRSSPTPNRPPRLRPPFWKRTRSSTKSRRNRPAPAPANPHLPQTIPLQGPIPAPAPARPPPPPLPAPLAAAPAPVPVRPAVEPAAPGSWFAALLFFLVLACGAGLAAFTFLRPYLPPGWLP